MNAIQAIYPYKEAGLWVFDDEHFEVAPKLIYAKFEKKPA